jgi:DNA polymerase I
MKVPTREIVFDAETNGLLQEASQLWIVVARSITTNENFIYCDFPGTFPKDFLIKPISQLNEDFNSAKALIGHNIIGFDLPVLKKLVGLTVNKRVSIVDTMIMSQVLDYKRFGFGHGLAMFGKLFGRPKPEHEEWDRFSNEMIHRCVEDVEISVMTYELLKKELLNNPHVDRLKLGLKVEHRVSQFVAESHLKGFPFNRQAALELKHQLETEIGVFENYLMPKLLLKAQSIDGFQEDKNFKQPGWLKTGDYNAFTAKWFDVDPAEGREGRRPVWGSYCRVEFIWPDVASPDSIKAYLFSIGWEPDDWNFKKVGRETIKTSPKISSTSLAKLGYDGWAIDNLLTSKSRLAVLEGWLAIVTPAGRVHGDMFVIGTPTGRAVHKIVANIPQASVEVFRSDGKQWVKDKSIKADYSNPRPWLPFEVEPDGTVLHVAERPWGPQVRALFTAIPGYKLVGADSSGNQFRALCHYLGDVAKDYTKAALEGDVHQIHADILSEVVPGTKRGTAKPFFYA